MALKHPIRENRAMAIQLLGELRSEKALDALESILRGGSDFYVLREVLHALAKLDTPQSRAILLSATHNPSKLVAKLAEELLTSVSR
jgi:HEAT repeat protein